MTGLVYCHTNRVSGKRYVGWTTKTMQERWREHCRDSRAGSISAFHCAIRKHGESDDVWNHEVLEESTCVDCESTWIEKLNSYRNGYNMTPGGEGVAILSDEAKERKRESLRQAWKRPETRQKHITSLRLTHPKRRQVTQINQDTNQSIATFPSLREASRQSGVAHESISACARGHMKHAGGFVWRYEC